MIRALGSISLAIGLAVAALPAAGDEDLAAIAAAAFRDADRESLRPVALRMLARQRLPLRFADAMIDHVQSMQHVSYYLDRVGRLTADQMERGPLSRLFDRSDPMAEAMEMGEELVANGAMRLGPADQRYSLRLQATVLATMTPSDCVRWMDGTMGLREYDAAFFKVLATMTVDEYRKFMSYIRRAVLAELKQTRPPAAPKWGDIARFELAVARMVFDEIFEAEDGDEITQFLHSDRTGTDAERCRLASNALERVLREKGPGSGRLVTVFAIWDGEEVPAGKPPPGR